LFISTKHIGLKDLGNCVYDEQGNIWVHEIEGCRVWKFNLAVCRRENSPPYFGAFWRHKWGLDIDRKAKHPPKWGQRAVVMSSPTDC